MTHVLILYKNFNYENIPRPKTIKKKGNNKIIMIIFPFRLWMKNRNVHNLNCGWRGTMAPSLIVKWSFAHYTVHIWGLMAAIQRDIAPVSFMNSFPL
jgi:hypothetical protein